MRRLRQDYPHPLFTHTRLKNRWSFCDEILYGICDKCHTCMNTLNSIMATSQKSCFCIHVYIYIYPEDKPVSVYSHVFLSKSSQLFKINGGWRNDRSHWAHCLRETSNLSWIQTVFNDIADKDLKGFFIYRRSNWFKPLCTKWILPSGLMQ